MKIEADELLHEQLEEAVQLGLSKKEVCNIYLSNKLFVGERQSNDEYIDEVYSEIIKFLKGNKDV